MNDTQQIVIETARDAAIAAVASKTTWFGAITAIAGFLASSGMGVLIGSVIGILSLLVNWYYLTKRDRREQAYMENKDRREQEEHERRMSK